MSGLAERIAELGPWFHNLRIGGIETAPDHPLGDYPGFKWRRFGRSAGGGEGEEKRGEQGRPRGDGGACY